MKLKNNGNVQQPLPGGPDNPIKQICVLSASDKTTWEKFREDGIGTVHSVSPTIQLKTLGGMTAAAF